MTELEGFTHGLFSGLAVPCITLKGNIMVGFF